MKTALGPSAHRLVALLLLTAHGAAWAQAATPAPVPVVPLASDRPVQAPAEPTAPAPQPIPAYTPPPMTKSQRELQRRLSLRHYALMGVATVLTGGGIYFGARSKGTLNTAEDSRTQREAYEKLKESRRQAQIANYAYAGAGLAVVSAVVTYFISPPRPPPEDPNAPPEPDFGGFR
jgi:hypothetical protein